MAVVVDMLRNQCCNSSYQMSNHNLIVVREVVSLANTICILNGQRVFFIRLENLSECQVDPLCPIGNVHSSFKGRLFG